MPEQQTATASSAVASEPVPSCWIYLSQDLPFPLRGKYTCVGLNAPDLVAQIPLTLLVDTKEMPVWITREHIVAVM